MAEHLSQEQIRAAARLKGRQLAVLVAIAQGHTMADTAEVLHVALSTVKTHLKIIRWALGARNTTHAVAIATAVGVIRLQDLAGEEVQDGAS